MSRVACLLSYMLSDVPNSTVHLASPLYAYWLAIATVIDGHVQSIFPAELNPYKSRWWWWSMEVCRLGQHMTHTVGNWLVKTGEKERRAVLRQRRSSASLPYQDRNDPTMKLYNRTSTEKLSPKNKDPYWAIIRSRHTSELDRDPLSGPARRDSIGRRWSPLQLAHTGTGNSPTPLCALALHPHPHPHTTPCTTPPLGYTYFRISIAINEWVAFVVPSSSLQGGSRVGRPGQPGQVRARDSALPWAPVWASERAGAPIRYCCEGR